jgi:hypothetical protein
MYKTINFSDFCDEFHGSQYENNFTYEGKQALFEYLENLEEDIGEKIEFDMVAICCDYNEYSDAIEAASNYFEFEGMNFDENGDETETRDEVEEKALKFLEDRTQVIVFDK